MTHPTRQGPLAQHLMLPVMLAGVSSHTPTSVLPGGQRAPGTGNRAGQGDTDAIPTSPPLLLPAGWEHGNTP